MKKLIFMALIGSMYACKPKPPVDYVVLSGTIQNLPQNNTLSINALDRSFTKNIKISKDGHFIDTLRNNTKDYILYDSKHPIFLHLNKGDHVIINYDVNNLDATLNFSGNGFEISRYLKDKRDAENMLLQNKKDFYKLDEVAYKKLLKQLVSSQKNILEQAASLPKDYIENERKNIDYFYLSKLNDYERAHAFYTQKQGFKVSSGFLSELESLNYENTEDYNFSIYYKKLVNYHFGTKAMQRAQTERISNGIALVKTLETISNPELKNGLLFDYASKNLEREQDINTFYNLYMNTSTNQAHKKEIKTLFRRLKGFTPGDAAPEFIDYENYAGGTTSLSDLKGKYLYIDVWATWCGPCIRELPALQALEKKLHGKNIEFVSISIDTAKNYERWKALIKSRQLKGVQLLADNGWQSAFVKDFGIKGIPRFILLDPDGKIINANAPRPSNPGLVNLLESLNI